MHERRIERQQIPGDRDVAAQRVPRLAQCAAIGVRVNVHPMKTLQEPAFDIALHDGTNSAGRAQMRADHENAVALAARRARGGDPGVGHGRLLAH